MMNTQPDVIPLADALPLMPRETAFSYVSRLAAFYGCQSSGHFCDDFGISLPKLMDGDNATLRHLAELTRADSAELLRWSAKNVANRSRSINSEQVEFSKLSRSSWSFCVACAQEDILANPHLAPDLVVYGRSEWQASFVRTCQRHNVRLRSYSVATAARMDLGNFVAKFMAEFDGEECVKSIAGPMEVYVISRLLGQSHQAVPLLDDLALSSVVALCRSMGAAIEGDLAQFEKCDAARLEFLETRGFSAFADGEESLLEACREMRERHWKDNARDGCLVRVSRTIRGTKRDAGMKSVGWAIAKAAFSTFPFNVGERLFGLPCERPVLMRSRSARLTLGISEVIWARFLSANPAWVTYSDGDPMRTLIDIEAAKAYFAGRLPFTSLRSFGVSNGLRNHDLERFKEAGILRPADFPELRYTPPIYSRPELEAALAAFPAIAGAANDNEIPSGFVNLAALCRKYPVSLTHVQGLISSGELPFVKATMARNPNETIWVDLHTALEKSLGVLDPMDVAEVAGVLRVNSNAVRLLAHTGRIRAHARPWRNGTYYAFSRLHVEAFHRRYIFPTEMAELGIPTGVVRSVERVSHPEWKTGAILLYHRSDAERAA